MTGDFSSNLTEYLKDRLNDLYPSALYDPVSYLLFQSSKRIRSKLVYISGTGFGSHEKALLPYAAAVEFFHNFSLMHDDIMDDATLRRGQLPVHLKYDLPSAILSGDVMMVLAQKELDKYENSSLSEAYNVMAQRVCEGQRMDMDFESIENVKRDQYLEMVRLKTGALLGFCLSAGGFFSDEGAESLTFLKELGEMIGIYFQIQDDFLDVFGQSGETGKLKGGDIIAGKKTFLHFQALMGNDDSYLSDFQRKDDPDRTGKIFKHYRNLGVEESTLAFLERLRKELECNLGEIENDYLREKLQLYLKKLISRKK